MVFLIADIVCNTPSSLSSSSVLIANIDFFSDALGKKETGHIYIKIKLFMHIRVIIPLIAFFIYCELFIVVISELFRCFNYLFNYLKHPINPITLIGRITRLNLINFIRILGILIILSSLLIILNKLTFLINIGPTKFCLHLDR